MSEALHAALAMRVPELHRHCRDPWVLIGSAAASLSGADVTVADLDVLTSVRDAEYLIVQWQQHVDDVHVPEDASRFRSHFSRFRFPELPVDVMGGLQLNSATGWQPVQVDEVVTVSNAGVVVPIPSVTEQIRVLESFGRPKDLQRAARLRAL